MTATPHGKIAPSMPAHHIPVSLKLFTRVICIPLMALSTAFFGCISLICGVWDDSGRQQHFVARLWAKSLLRISFSPIEIVGGEKLREFSVAVYASNHLSYMDTPVLYATMPFQFRILAKQGLWKIPFVGWYLRRSGQVPIDSGSPRSAIAGLLRGVAALKAGVPLMVFPEGARSPDGRLQMTASGCAFMAIKAQVPLVPIALIGTYELLPIHVYSLRPRVLRVVVGDPILTDGLTTRESDELTERLYREIGAMYGRYTACNDTVDLPAPNGARSQ